MVGNNWGVYYDQHEQICRRYAFHYSILSTSNRIPTRGSSKKGSHVYFLLIVAMVLLLWRQVCTIVTSEQHLYQTIIQFDKTIVLPRNFATGSIHDYLVCNCSLVGILFEVLRIPSVIRIPTSLVTWYSMYFLGYFQVKAVKFQVNLTLKSQCICW